MKCLCGGQGGEQIRTTKIDRLDNGRRGDNWRPKGAVETGPCNVVGGRSKHGLSEVNILGYEDVISVTT